MRRLSAAVLVAVNIVPLVGVAFWGWSLMLILVLYWIESGIVGLINVFKIARGRAFRSLLPRSLSHRLPGVHVSATEGPSSA